MSDPNAELRALLTTRFDRIDARLDVIDGKIKAAHDLIENQAKERESADGRLGRSIDRVKFELDAVSRAQGVQATKVLAICDKLGIRESVHDASEPPQAAGGVAGE